MDIKKLAPWNWFKKEEDEMGYDVPVKTERNSDNLFSSSHNFHNEVDRMFKSVFDVFGSNIGSISKMDEGIDGSFFKPSLDLRGDEKEYSLSVEIPGVSEKDIKVEIERDTLTITGEKKNRIEEKEKNFYRIERSFGSFRRVLSLPSDADRENINAVFKNGVLDVSIPRIVDKSDNIKKIEIKCA